MKQRFLTFILALGLLTVTVPASATHLSVGGEDTVGTPNTADETQDTPSVEGTAEDGKEDSPFGLGTATDCTEVDESELSADRTVRALNSQGFCGQLAYHEGSGQLLQKSPVDQDLPKPQTLISRFDMVRAGYVGALGSSTCLPTFCGAPGETLFRAAHDVGSDLGLTEDPDTATKKGGDRFQTYSYSLTYPSANALIDANADTWRMNGWSSPHVTESFVGYILGPDGQAVDDQKLGTLFDKAKGQFTFPDGTTRGDVCGFTPDAEISINAASQGICEIDVSYVSEGGEGPTNGGDFKDGYNNEPCKSPTYVCGAANDHWAATLTCFSSNPCSDSGPTDTGYTRLHWVIAPTQSACTGQQEPGFLTDTSDSGADIPYMAHDLDVYVPPTSVNNVDQTQGVSNTEDYAIGAAIETTPDVPNVDNPELPDLPETPADELTAGQDNRVAKQNLVEPNARTPSSLAESSQKLSGSDDPALQPGDLEEGLCSPFNNQVETQETHDPWVNVLDMGAVVRGHSETGGLTGLGVYNNTADRQDDTNTNGPTPFYTSGKVGMFRDANDDGDYDQVPNSNQFSNIQSAGAYPLFWDMRVDGNGDVKQDGGCSFGFGSGPRLPAQMQTAGYGPATGLVQAIYLKEPTAASFGEQVIEFPAGNNIYLLESQAIHELRGEDSRVDAFVNDITQGVKDINGVQDDATVVNLADRFGTDNLFDPQCAEDTGGFSTQANLLHDCSIDCNGDTIVTGYLAELQDETIGAQTGQIPFFTPDGETSYQFPTSSGFIEWTDVDPFDSNPNRQDDTDSSPQT